MPHRREGKKRRRAARAPHARHLRIEQLEDRRLLAAAITVNSTADTDARDAFLTLREAILINNRTLAVGSLTAQEQAQIVGAPTGVDTDTIKFNIPGAGPHTISPTSALPNITDPMILDGYTQPGAAANTGTPQQALNTVLRIELAGNLTPSSTGLRLAAGSGGSTIRGLAVNRFANNLWIDTHGNMIAGNFVGTNISGTAAMPGGNNGVLLISAANNTIGGTNPADSNLISGNGTNGITIVETGANNNVIRGNRIGTDITGTVDLGNAIFGVYLYRAPGTIIGGNTAAARNLISGNNNSGIWMDENSHDTIIQGNLIGTNLAGTQKIGNNNIGIQTNYTSRTIIGGLGAGEGNIIAGGAGYAINIQNGVAPSIQGNRIGTDASGTLNLGNEGGIFLSSVRDSTIKSNTIAFNNGGIAVSGNTFGDLETGNLISRNSIYGTTTAVAIDLFGTTGVVNGPDFPQDATDSDTGANNLQNFPIITSVTDLGGMTRVEGTLTSLLNSSFRLEFFASAMPTSSGFGPGQTFLGDLDIAIGGSNNTVSFIVDLPAIPSGQTLITATATDITNPGIGPRNNTSEFSPAVAIDTAFRVTTTSDQAGATLRQALLAANFSPGVNTITFNIPANDPNHFYYQNDGIAGQVSQANIATTTAANDASIANIDPDWAHSWFSIELGSKLVMTDEVIIDGYTQPGAAANTNAVGQGLNSILKIEINGENAIGIVALDGLIHVDTGDSTLRGLVINRAGVLATSGMHVQLRSGTNNKIEGNYIGTDVSGTYSYELGFNTFEPVFAAVGVYHSPGSPISANTIGGTTPAARNLLSGTSAGVAFFDTAPNNVVQGNLIGTDRSGTRAVGNRTGVWVETVGTLIGGAVAGAGNVISGNETAMEVSDFLDNSSGNIIQNNRIGTDVTGATGLGNVQSVVVGGDNNGIRGNTIAFNGGPGVVIGSLATGNLISQNSIHSNETLGIDLSGNGLTLNDVPPQSNPPDQDTGGNNQQNYPTLTSVNAVGGGTQVQGSLSSTPNSNFRIEFFANRDRDEGIYDFTNLDNPNVRRGMFAEGQTYIGFFDVVTDASGVANFTANLPALPADQPFVTATATDVTNPGGGPRNHTSEFSPVFPLGGPSTVVTNTGDLGVGTLREAIFVANITPGYDTITFNIPPTDPRHFYYRSDGVAEQVTLANVTTTTAANDASIPTSGPNAIDPDWAHSWFSILPASDLPEIDDRVRINGYSQPGSSPNTLPAPGALNTVLKIEVNGGNVAGDGLAMVDHGDISRFEGLAINRFGGHGVTLNSDGDDVNGGSLVVGNFIGVDVSGTVDLGNGGHGVNAQDEINRIGGLSPELRNLISGNGGHGVLIHDSGLDAIQGNVIGANRTAAATLGNDGWGLLTTGPFLVAEIGGVQPGAGNLFADNALGGIAITGGNPAASDPLDLLADGRTFFLDTVQKRATFFATNDPADYQALQDSLVTTFIFALTHGMVGLAMGNVILGNRFVTDDSAGLGIDLGVNGVTLNDLDDGDGGVNDRQNFPVVATAMSTAVGTTVTGALNSIPSASYRVEFFASNQSTSSGYGPGENFLGSVNVTTNAGGDASFNFSTPQLVPTDQFVTATATLLFDLDANAATPATPVETSEFSLAKLVTSGAPVLGDYNGNGIVDAADYTIWRDTRGSTTDLRANGDSSNSVIDTADLQVWRSRFGSLLGSGSGSTADDSLGAGSSESATEMSPMHLGAEIYSARRTWGRGNSANRTTIASGESKNHDDLLLLALAELVDDKEDSNKPSPMKRNAIEPTATTLARDLALADWTAF